VIFVIIMPKKWELKNSNRLISYIQVLEIENFF